MNRIIVKIDLVVAPLGFDLARLCGCDGKPNDAASWADDNIERQSTACSVEA